MWCKHELNVKACHWNDTHSTKYTNQYAKARRNNKECSVLTSLATLSPKHPLVEAVKQGKPSSNPTPQPTPQPAGTGGGTGGGEMIAMTHAQGALAIDRMERVIKSDEARTLLADMKKLFALN